MDLDTRTDFTRWRVTPLLIGGVIAGPLYILIGLVQVVLREGFDIRRHSLSLLSNGDLGWIQITSFLLCGVLLILCATGMYKVLHHGKGSIWGSLLIAGYGVGLIGSGVFVADPALGFPPGTAEGVTETMSTSGLLHFISGSLGFFAFIAACFVFARRFRTIGLRGWALFSFLTGVFFLVAFIGIASGTGSALINLVFTAAVILSWFWITLLSLRLIRESRHNEA